MNDAFIKLVDEINNFMHGKGRKAQVSSMGNKITSSDSKKTNDENSNNTSESKQLRDKMNNIRPISTQGGETGHIKLVYAKKSVPARISGISAKRNVKIAGDTSKRKIPALSDIGSAISKKKRKVSFKIQNDLPKSIEKSSSSHEIVSGDDILSFEEPDDYFAGWLTSSSDCISDSSDDDWSPVDEMPRRKTHGRGNKKSPVKIKKSPVKIKKSQGKNNAPKRSPRAEDNPKCPKKRKLDIEDRSKPPKKRKSYIENIPKTVKDAPKTSGARESKHKIAKAKICKSNVDGVKCNMTQLQIKNNPPGYCRLHMNLLLERHCDGSSFSCSYIKCNRRALMPQSRCSIHYDISKFFKSNPNVTK